MQMKEKNQKYERKIENSNRRKLYVKGNNWLQSGNKSCFDGKN